MKVTYGDIYAANLNPTIGSEQGGVRPVIIVQSDVGNIFSHTTIIIPLTSSTKKGHSDSTHVFIKKNSVNNLDKDCLALCEQIRTVDVSRVFKKIGKLSEEELTEIKKKIKICIPGL